MNPAPLSDRPVPPPSSAEEALPRRFGKYTLLRRMATGGMAEIFLALQRSVAGFEKLIVIKRILPAMNGDRGFIDMLLHEARVAASLSHPNIVQTIDVGQVEGNYYIALEHVHGEDLRSIVRQMKKKGVMQFPFEHAIAIILGMCAGLSYAHERRDLDGTPLSIVHRDVSPQNVIVGFAGDVKVVDFGVAKSGTQTEANTKSGQLKGKVPYMSPEQARGEEVDWRTDIFAVGVMLFELTTGKRLFKGATEYETLKLIIEREYPRPSWVSTGYPPALEQIVMRALSKDRETRYQSAREMQADLEAFVRDEKLPVSSIALAEFMKTLFEEKLAAQKEALMQGRQLAEIIAAEVNHHNEHTISTGIDSARPSFTSLSTSGAGSTVGSVPPQKSGSTKWALLMLPIAAAAAAGGVFLLMKKGDSAPSDKSAANVTNESVAPTRAKVILKSDPPGAHVWINSEMRSEVTPAEIDGLPIGTIDVKVGLEGYAAQTEKITLVANTPTTRNFTLKKGVVTFQIDGAPKSATATLDGKPVTLPSIEATPGTEHTLVLSAAGMKDKTLKVKGDAAEVKKLDGSLEKGFGGMTSGVMPKGTSTAKEPAGGGGGGGSGKISVSSSGGWCNATVDGKPLGPTPTGMIEVSAGSHSVSCTDSNGKTMSQGAKVNAGETTRVKFTIAG
jgi:eukaryotic-like serine/threonine-protein kinase